jgi:chaperonin GroES
MKKETIMPLGDNILIEFAEAKKKTELGIYLPESSSKETPQEGKVVEIGESKDIKVKKGQRVIFRPYSGTDIKLDGKKFMILKNEDILAVIK